jgi:hypothetical protein
MIIIFIIVVGHKMGVKSTMVLGSFTYSLLMAVVNLKTDWLLMVMSALNGIGAALLVCIFIFLLIYRMILKYLIDFNIVLNML